MCSNELFPALVCEMKNGNIRIVGLALVLSTPSTDVSSQTPSVPVSDACSVRETDRRTLVLPNNQHLYIAPKTFVSNTRGEHLLAGNPNYIFMRGTDGKGVLVGRDSILGALFYGGGEQLRVIDAPIDPHLVVNVRASARTDGAWNIVFAERDSSHHDQPGRVDDRIVRLWYGIYNGTRWAALERIPFPQPIELSAAASATGPLIKTTDDNSLAWAVGARVADGPEGVVVFTRIGSIWSSQVVNTRSASVGGMVYESGELLFSVIAGDTDLPPGGSDRNSLFLWSSRRGEWTVARRVVRGGRDGPVLSASVHNLMDGSAVSWAAEIGEKLHLRAQIGASDRVQTIDDDLSAFYRYSSAPLGNMTHLWVTHHGRSPGAEGRSPQLRFSLLLAGEIRQIGELPSPVLDSFRITPGEREAGEIFLTGAMGIDEAGIVVSLVGRYRVVCSFDHVR